MLNLFKKSSLKTIDRETLDKQIEKFNLSGVSGDEKDVIISLTSFPQRMDELHYTLYSLLNQTIKPYKIILWLGREQFPNLNKDVPEKILHLQQNGSTIGWTKNLYSYTKLIPALKKYPDNTKLYTGHGDITKLKDEKEENPYF